MGSQDHKLIISDKNNTTNYNSTANINTSRNKLDNITNYKNSNKRESLKEKENENKTIFKKEEIEIN